MSNTAETNPGTPTAGGQEPLIPKYRLDEVTARLREAEETSKIKDRLYMEQLQMMKAQQQPRTTEVSITPEESGLDPQTHQAAMKIARTIVKSEMDQARGEVRGLVGAMANDLEKAKFLLKFGADKDKYLQQIEDYQKRHAQTTGGYLDVESAYKMVRFDESESQSRRSRHEAAPTAQAPSQEPAPQQRENDPGIPNRDQTRVQNPGGSSPNAAKGFSELSLEEMEARLQEAFDTGVSV